jgi:hypothetical protein
MRNEVMRRPFTENGRGIWAKLVQETAKLLALDRIKDWAACHSVDRSVEENINGRPRQRLGWKSPSQAFGEAVASIV